MLQQFVLFFFYYRIKITSSTIKDICKTCICRRHKSKFEDSMGDLFYVLFLFDKHQNSNSSSNSMHYIQILYLQYIYALICMTGPSWLWSYCSWIYSYLSFILYVSDSGFQCNKHNSYWYRVQYQDRQTALGSWYGPWAVCISYYCRKQTNIRV
jgi:hypothetical protein